jgi:RHS repeat-associated protein
MKEQFGTTTPLYHKLFYNSRGQLAEIRVGETYNGPSDDGWERGAIINHYAQCWGACQPTSSMTDNNGNLRQQDHWIPNGSGGVQAIYVQNYDYDSLNRLQRVREGSNWQQEYFYDRWGNRTVHQTNTYGTGIPKPNFGVDTATNRLMAPAGSSMSYDFAGNLTNDTYTGAGNREYDAENRMRKAWGGSNQWQEYTYDGEGHRTRRKVDGVETWQVYGFAGELLAEYPANGAAASPQKEYGYRNGQLLVTAAAATGRTNYALATNGATATASSTFTAYPFSPGAAIDGEHKGLNWLNGGGWHGSTATFPQWLEVTFSGSKVIDEIDVFTAQDNWQNPSEPTETMTFSLYGLTGYEVQYWNGSTWVTVSNGSITGNNKVWKRITFAPISTSKIRLVTNASIDGWSRLPELEAWGGESSTNVALASNGGTASASSSYSEGGFNFTPAGANNGNRSGAGWGSGEGWNDNSPANTFPDWLQIDFNGNKTIDEINVFTGQDNWQNPSEPTEAMTFSLYGLTSYDVQYWSGSSWVTAPGGSVTGNNKVWRKFTFAPITTSKIRVLTHASVDGYSRLTEVEAWGTEASQSTTGNINWLVTDQLGTPRMILDQSGSLAGVKRHDYLPFGEELFAGVGGRTGGVGGQGYGGGDGVRQKFTQKERDIETGLDYFRARYYASTQGRLTSTDPLLSTGFPATPQSWNRYSYTLNNPVRLIDPTGMFVIDPTLSADDQDKIKTSYNQLKASLSTYKTASSDYKRIQRALKTLGGIGVNNGITVTVGKTLNPDAGAQVVPTAIGYRGAKPVRLHATITLASGDFRSNNEAEIGESLGHEATHAADFKDLALAGVGVDKLWAAFDRIRYKSEFEAYMLSGAVRQALEPATSYELPGNIPVSEYNQLPRTLTKVPLWNPAWAVLDATKIQTQRSWAINSVLMTPKNQGGHYGLEPPKQ